MKYFDDTSIPNVFSDFSDLFSSTSINYNHKENRIAIFEVTGIFLMPYINTDPMQAAGTLLMIRPSQFAFNRQTSASNIFQKQINLPAEEIQQRALSEFDNLVKELRSNGIYVWVLQDNGEAETPDSIFPNNWISFLEEKIFLYPMFAENRRKERKASWVSLLQHITHKSITDFTTAEKENIFLEGTGSIVLDRINHIAYANLSSRTNEIAVKKFCTEINYEPVLFHALTKNNEEIYHTNVLMAVGEKVAVLCTEVISEESQRTIVLKKLSEHHQVIEISHEQMVKFAGNMLLVMNRDNKKFWVMSRRAFWSLTTAQIAVLKTEGDFIYTDIETIEIIGGGSARCMLAEVF